MNSREVKQIVGDTQNMTLVQAVTLTSFIEKNQVLNAKPLNFKF